MDYCLAGILQEDNAFGSGHIQQQEEGCEEAQGEEEGVEEEEEVCTWLRGRGTDQREALQCDR